MLLHGIIVDLTLERDPAKTAKNGTIHEMIGIRPKPINDIYAHSLATKTSSLHDVLPWSSHMLI